MIEPIGDLSKADKEVLTAFARSHGRILEGGVGASTQILTHYTKGRVVTYDSSPEWIARTRDVNFPQVGVDGDCEFRDYSPKTRIKGRYDLVFVDLEWSLRMDFARKAWECLVPGGNLVFHDARRDKDREMILEFMTEKYREIEYMGLCPQDSNLAVFRKREKRCDYVNWHKTEQMTDEQLGITWLTEK